MRTFLLLIQVITLAVTAQTANSGTVTTSTRTPQDLLRLAQNAYKNPTGYEMKGEGVLQPAGSSWQIRFPITIAASPAPLETPTAPASPGVRFGGPLKYTKVGDGGDEKPTSVSFPFSVTGGWSRMAENVTSVTEIGSEELPLNGTVVDCRLLEVQYGALPDDTKLAPVKYSICSDQHLALKKVMFNPRGRRSTDAAGLWTITLDSVQFHRPAPEWLLTLKNQPDVINRKEWKGKGAPDFALRDLEGKQVALSTLRGKVVLLDFWSTACAPCLREMPSIQKVADAHTNDLIVWGISFDLPERDKKWLAQHHQTFPTLSDSDFAVSDLYKVHGIPALVVIDRAGKIRDYWEGSVDINDLEAALKRANRQVAKAAK
jgi:peroxiredoxin